MFSFLDVPKESIFGSLPTETYQLVYCGLIIALFLLALTRSIVFYNICIRCSQKLHDLMFSKICRTHMSFFHKNPSGELRVKLKRGQEFTLVKKLKRF